MASPITPSTGLGSGLEIGKIVTALVDADKAAKQNQITTQTAKNDASLSGVAQLKAALSSFQTTMTTLGSSTSPAFNGFAATSSNESAVKATADNTAVNGTNTVKVSKLATGSKVATAAIDATQASAIPSGTLKITQNGIDYSVSLAAGSTLQQVRDQINTSMQGKGISANIINDANGSRLVFSSTTTGKGSDISVVGSGDIGSLLDIDGTRLMSSTGTAENPGAGAISAPAQDAEFTIDGLKLTSSKNTVTTAISGLKLDLLTADDKETTITVGTNTDGLKTSLQSFVDSYNTLVKLVSTLTKGTIAEDGTFTAAPMTGDSTPRNILAAIRSQIATATSNSGLGSLAQLGITTSQTDGTLSLDSTKFTAALNDKEFGGQIQNLFTAKDTGLLDRVASAIEPYTKTGGVLALKKDSLDKIGTRLGNEQEALDRRIETLTATLTKKYNAMDLVVSQLKATMSSVTSIFEAMNAQKNAS